jgi:hypothetical protein
MQNDSALRLLIATILGILCIAICFLGRPGSILGSLIDAQDMTATS